MQFSKASPDDVHLNWKRKNKSKGNFKGKDIKNYNKLFVI